MITRLNIIEEWMKCCKDLQSISMSIGSYWNKRNNLYEDLGYIKRDPNGLPRTECNIM